MKNIITLIIALFSLVSAPLADAQSARDVLGAILGGGSSEKTDSTSDTKGSGLGDILGGVAGALGLGNTPLTADALEGTWKYAAPAVSFKSDNLLLKAGGAAAAKTVEDKLLPYYKAAGLTNLVMTFVADSTFTMKARLVTISGTVEFPEKGGDNLTFNFKALGKINVGTMIAYAKLSSKDNLELTFDVSKLMTIIEKVGTLTNNSTIKGASAILEQYDGITAGFDLKKSTSEK